MGVFDASTSPLKMLCRRRARPVGAGIQPMESPMAQSNDLSRSVIPFCQESTLIVVVDLIRLLDQEQIL